MRLAQDQNEAAADIIEQLKADNDRLRNSDARSSRSSSHSHDELSVKIGELEAELRTYKEIVSQMASDRNVFNHQLSSIMDASGSPKGGLEPVSFADERNERALVVVENSTNAYPDSMMETNLSHTSAGRVEEQIQNLTIENGELAQRLGNAVADKECKWDLVHCCTSHLEPLLTYLPTHYIRIVSSCDDNLGKTGSQN